MKTYQRILKHLGYPFRKLLSLLRKQNIGEDDVALINSRTKLAFNNPPKLDFKRLKHYASGKDMFVLDFNRTITANHLFLTTIHFDPPNTLSNDIMQILESNFVENMGGLKRIHQIGAFLRQVVKTKSHVYIATFSQNYQACLYIMQLVCDYSRTSFEQVKHFISCTKDTAYLSKDKNQMLDHIEGEMFKMEMNGKILYCDDDYGNIEQSKVLGYRIIPTL